MDKSSKVRRKPFRWSFKGFKRTRSSDPAQPPNPSESLKSSDTLVPDYDMQRTRNRHLEACKLLAISIKACQQDSTWNFLEFRELEGEFESFDEQFLQSVNRMLESRKNDIRDETAWAKCRDTIECIFTALSPFFKNFFTIATNVQSVP
jgi:hypothetical protein